MHRLDRIQSEKSDALASPLAEVKTSLPNHHRHGVSGHTLRAIHTRFPSPEVECIREVESLIYIPTRSMGTKANGNTRRFGTAKRLKQIMNLSKGCFSHNTIKDLKLLNPIQYILTFGSAKPTGAY